MSFDGFDNQDENGWQLEIIGPLFSQTPLSLNEKMRKLHFTFKVWVSTDTVECCFFIAKRRLIIGRLQKSGLKCFTLVREVSFVRIIVSFENPKAKEIGIVLHFRLDYQPLFRK